MTYCGESTLLTNRNPATVRKSNCASRGRRGAITASATTAASTSTVSTATAMLRPVIVAGQQVDLVSQPEAVVVHRGPVGQPRIRSRLGQVAQTQPPAVGIGGPRAVEVEEPQDAVLRIGMTRDSGTDPWDAGQRPAHSRPAAAVVQRRPDAGCPRGHLRRLCRRPERRGLNQQSGYKREVRQCLEPRPSRTTRNRPARQLARAMARGTAPGRAWSRLRDSHTPAHAGRRLAQAS